MNKGYLDTFPILSAHRGANRMRDGSTRPRSPPPHAGSGEVEGGGQELRMRQRELSGCVECSSSFGLRGARQFLEVHSAHPLRCLRASAPTPNCACSPGNGTGRAAYTSAAPGQSSRERGSGGGTSIASAGFSRDRPWQPSSARAAALGRRIASGVLSDDLAENFRGIIRRIGCGPGAGPHAQLQARRALDGALSFSWRKGF